MSEPDSSKSDADFRTFLALFVLLAMAGLFIGLTAIVLPQALGIVLVCGGMILFGVTHYVVWGWWLPRFLKRDSDTLDDSP